MTISLSPELAAEWLVEIRRNAVTCEARRPFTRKPGKTGTISEAASLYLRAIVDAVQPRVCIEIGTFIGTSTMVLASTGAHVFTCDKDNDVFKSQGTIVAYGRCPSTSMLDAIAGGTVADLWFFDGRIQVEDLSLVQQLSHAKTVYAFDDYEGNEKGVINVERLRLWLPSHYALVPPPARVMDLESATTIALLVPNGGRG